MPEKRPVLYLMLGYPGAGKTTAAEIIHTVTGARHIWADRQRQALFGQPQFGETESTKLYDILNREAEEFLLGSQDVVYDTNFNYRRDRDRLRAIAANAGARTVVVWVRTPLELAKIRATGDDADNHTRVWGNMSTQDFERLSHVLEEPADDEDYVMVDGTKINQEYIRRVLELKDEDPAPQTS